jgi:hypothetical protein
VTVALDRKTAVAKIDELAHRTDVAAPLARRRKVFAQFVALDAQRQMRLDVLDRIVARVGVERVHRIHAVEPVAPAVTASRISICTHC